MQSVWTASADPLLCLTPRRLVWLQPEPEPAPLPELSHAQAAAEVARLEGELGTAVENKQWKLAETLQLELDRAKVTKDTIPDPESMRAELKRLLSQQETFGREGGYGAAAQLQPRIELLRRPVRPLR